MFRTLLCAQVKKPPKNSTSTVDFISNNHDMIEDFELEFNKKMFTDHRHLYEGLRGHWKK